MLRNSILSLLILIGGFLFFINHLTVIDAQTANMPSTSDIEKAKAELLANLCSGHGGVNCSIINAEASVVCNDGVVDQSMPSIYAVPQCQEAALKLATEQSDFMAKSGCYPPSEIGCFNEQSYQNLSKILSTIGLVNSELGKNELTQCRQEINNFNRDSTRYKQCLSDHKQQNFKLSGKSVLPIIKTMFCPIIYGPKATYNLGADLCVCDSGYFMADNKCIQASQICQSKYGSNSYAKNGNCIRPASISKIIPSPTPSTVLRTPISSPNNYPKITLPPEISNMYPNPDQNQEISEEIIDLPDKPRTNFIQNILDSIISGIKKMLRLS